MSEDQPPNDLVLRFRDPLSHKTGSQVEMIWISQYPQRDRALLWQGFEGEMGMIGDRVKAGSCQNWDIGQIVCHRHTDTMPGFLRSILHELSPVIMRFYTVFRAKMSYIWHGILTGQKNYRITNAVIVQFYRLGLIIDIMGPVSYLRHLEQHAVAV